MTTTGTAYTYQWRKLCEVARATYPAACHLCGKGIDLALPAQDRMAWTLDHLHPVETHGPDIPQLADVRPAHRACNGRRGSRPVRRAIHSEEW